MSTAPGLVDLLRVMSSANWTRDDAHTLLDSALDLAAGAGDMEGEPGRLAQAAAMTLSRAVAGWMVHTERTPDEWNDLAGAAPEVWREEVIERMRLTPAFLPQPVVDMLMFALVDLQGGKQPPPILKPKSHSEARRNSRHALQQAMLVWIEIEKARGRPAGEVRNEVVKASTASLDAMERWVSEWRKRDGWNHVDEVLHTAASIARGEVVSAIPEELLLIRFFQSGKGSPLSGLASSWKAAKVDSAI